MKTRTSILAAALVAAASSAALADVVDFEGVIKFTSKTAACPATVYLGSVMRSRFHPTTAMAAANGGWLGINRDAEMWSEAWGNAGKVSTSTFSRVNYGIVFDHFTGRTSNLDPAGSLASIKFNAIPSGLTVATKFVQLSGQIQNPFSAPTQATCAVGFTGAYINRRYLAP
jgi:hypothetical protein